MSLTLRVLLIIASIMSFILCIKKVQKAKLQMTDSVIWMLGSFLLIIMSLFPNIVMWISRELGFIAPVNFVFLIIIAFLLIKLYYTDLKISGLNEKIKNINHYIALNEYGKNKDEKR